MHGFAAGWSSPVARQAHNLKVVGSNPAPATKSKSRPRKRAAFLLLWAGSSSPPCEPDCQRIDGIPHDFVLGRDDVGQVTIEPVGPKVPAALAIDEPSRDTIQTGHLPRHAVHCH